MNEGEVAGAALTVGTAGHIDHGKTALVQALTGIDTDRLPEEKARGITIVLGFAPLRLPNGRMLSLIDVPGHERLVRVMVSGASGIDLFLLVIAADDGVMPQTLEHVRVLRSLGIQEGMVAVTKADLADPAPVLRAAAELLPDAERAACSVRTGEGVDAVAAGLERVAARVQSRTGSPGVVLHIDRVFSIRGAGTVVTGTLWGGAIARGERLLLMPAGLPVRVRGVQVHDRPAEVAQAGQRVAVNLTGVELRQVRRGDALVGEGVEVGPTHRMETELELHEPLEDRARVQVHHGTRSSPARAVRLDERHWQLRLEQPLIAADGDRVVIRRISPAGTLGGGVVVRATAGARGRPQASAQPGERRARVAVGRVAGGSPALDERAQLLEQRLRTAGAQPPGESELGDQRESLRALLAAGRAVRIGRMYAHVDAVSEVRQLVERVIEHDGSITLSRLRDELGTSRKYAQAFLEHLDAARVTRRRQDDSRVLRASRPHG